MFRHGGKNAPKVYAGVSPRKGAARSRRPTPDPEPQPRERTEPVSNPFINVSYAVTICHEFCLYICVRIKADTLFIGHLE